MLRVQKELEDYERSVDAGVLWPKDGILSVAKCAREIPASYKQSTMPKGGTKWIHKDFIAHMSAQITGPAGSPYEGGIFGVSLNYGPDYPVLPPCVVFTTKVYHPSVNSDGAIGFDLLQHLGCTGRKLRQEPFCQREVTRALHHLAGVGWRDVAHEAETCMSG